MKCRILPLLIFLCLIIPSVCAAGITLAADKNEYFFALGESADVPVAVANGLNRPVDGTLLFSTVEQLQTAGTMMTSTNSRMYSYSVPPGDSEITVSTGSSDVEKTVRVQVAYDYTDTAPVKVSLPEIIIHFVAQPPPSSGTQSPITSTSAQGSGNSQATSSVQIVQQSMSVQQQAGRQGTVQQAISNNQMPQDANALKEQLTKDAAKKVQEKNQFDEKLGLDPLVKSVNESLAADGFFRESLVTNPENGDAGTFAMEYRKDTGEKVTVSGAMENGAVPSVREMSGAPINVTAPLSTNTTYRSMTTQLGEQGFSRNETILNISPDQMTINLTYQNKEGKRAFINATSTAGNITQLTMETEPETAFNYLPMVAIIVIAGVIVIGIWIIYRRYHMPKLQATGKPVLLATPREPVNHRKAAAALLLEAETAFAKQRFADAYGLAGQALRLFLSYEYGARHEMTNSEMIMFLRAQNRDFYQIQTILDRCTDVEFAKGKMDEREFFSCIEYIRRLITEP